MWEWITVELMHKSDSDAFMQNIIKVWAGVYRKNRGKYENLMDIEI